MTPDFKKVKSVFFVGVGGIGISAIARMMLLEGKRVVGSDRAQSKVTEELVANGARIFIGHKAEQVPADCDLVIQTVAIPENSPELVEARRRGLPIITYPQALKEVSREKFTIAISGTHGKTTTTAMTAKIMIDAGLRPTVVVGSLLPGENTNFISGDSQYLVVEADEYRNAFFNLSPKIFVINNIDADHLDFFKDLADVQSSFRRVAESVPADGFVIYDGENPRVAPVVSGLKCNLVDYSHHKSRGVKLQVPGAHNRSNAAAAMAVAEVLGVDPSISIRALSDFKGTWRRFEYKGKTKAGALVYDDYAHNPQKVRAALQGAREMFPDKKIAAIFQPHLYSRTKLLLEDFATSFGEVDELILLPIYAAREPNDPTITSDILADKIKKPVVRVVHGPEDAVSLISPSAEVIITIGAGDVTQISDTLTR